ncbi:putative aquaporin transporter [Lupinus albus]|uniref:Putative aquaporin transporter n=1 Tax=Lupinus albus TaxID=3870 RepID=A0A6A4PBM0_LUPAL|nr:putative aquaporin transporter [Lupinus albus]
MGRAQLLVSDFVISFMWVWSGVLVKELVCKNMGLCNEPIGEILKLGLNIITMFIFAFLGKITHGGASNPINILAGAVSQDFDNFLYCMGARIPSQVSLFCVRFVSVI